MSFNLITDLDPSHQADAQDRGLHYGDGLFETLLIHQGNVRYWQEHYARLYASCERLKIPCPQQSWLERALQPYVDSAESLIVKIIITRGTGGRGLSLSDKTQPNVYIFKYPVELSHINQPIRVTISEVTLSKSPLLAGIKHLNRLFYVLATQQLQSENNFDEALLLDSEGYLVEAIVHNLFFISNDITYTPDLTASGVDGIMRNLVLKKLKELDKPVKIGHYTPEQLFQADECFLCNSVQGIRPITLVKKQRFDPGPVTRLLQQSIHGL